jgi:hypothetical protein
LKGSKKNEKKAMSPHSSSKTMLTRSASSPNPARHSKDIQSPSPQTPPTRVTRKRTASLVDTTGSKARLEDCSPPSSRESNRMPSVGAGEFAGHVCLCQPEPKIRRPRNGESLSESLCPVATERALYWSADKDMSLYRLLIDATGLLLILCSIYSVSPASPADGRGSSSWTCKP